MTGVRRRRRVLHIAQPTNGGVAEVVVQLCGFGQDEYDHVVITPPGELARRAGDKGASTRIVEMTRQPGIGDVVAFVRLLRACRGADLIVLHSSKAGVLGRCVGWVTRKPTIFIPHGWSWRVGGRLAPLYVLLERLLARVASATVVVGTEELDAGRRELGSQANLVLIENAVPTKMIRPVDGRANSAILVLGRVTRQKGQDLAIRALARTTAPIDLVIVGDGETGDLMDLAHSLGVGDRIEFRPAAPAATVLREFAIVALPSRWEGLPLVMLEAMSAGCAVIASSEAGAAALRGAGVVVPMPSEDDFVERLAEQFDRLARNDTEISTLGSQARAVAEAHYDIARLEEDYLELWAKVLAARECRRRW